MKKVILFIVLIVIVGVAYFFYKNNVNIPPTSDEEVSTEGDFTLPAPFKISLFAENVPNARVLTFAPQGVILVSQTQQGKISALPNKNGDGKADEVVTVVSGLTLPHGMAFRCTDPTNPDVCELYVAERDALLVFDYDAATMKAVNKKKLINLPAGSQTTHFTRTLLFMPSPNENTLLISIGSSCNVCDETDVNRASILAYDVVSGKTEQFAKGLRNSVFMEIHPVTGKIWATEMGRDYLGDNLPPDEINIIEKGKNYGWPICYGKNIHDTNFDNKTYIRNPCLEPFETQSLVDLPAHSAPLGIAFVPEEGWPEEYWFNLFVAYHGSWNRSVPDGYKIVRLKFNAKGGYVSEENFIIGWLKSDGTKIGRPVDIKVLPGGTMYISDDLRGAIYKVTRNDSI
jgi:glucose/arabinose dehydrogenase